MIKTDYFFKMDGFAFMADFEVGKNGVDISGLWLESGIDDEMIEITEGWRILIAEKHLTKEFKEDIDILNSDKEYYRECNTSDTFRPGY
jgi:hypothetical protein